MPLWLASACTPCSSGPVATRRPPILLQGAISGTRQVSTPVIFGVLTTAAAFVPLMLGPGTIGQIQQIIGTVVLCCLVFSLIESQLVLPSHLAHGSGMGSAGEVGLLLVPLIGIALMEVAWDTRSFLALAIACGAVLFAWHLQGGFRRFSAALIDYQQRFSEYLERLIEGRFRRLVSAATEARYATAACAVATLIATVGALAGGHMPFSFFPAVPADQVVARLTMPLGTPVATTERALEVLAATAESLRRDLEQEYPQAPPATHILAALGGHPMQASGATPSGGGGGDSGSGGHLAEVTLQLTPGEDRDASTLAIAQRWRTAVGTIPEATELSFDAAGFNVGTEIDIQLEGEELTELAEVALRIRERLAEYPGVIDIADSFRAGKQELKLRRAARR